MDREDNILDLRYNIIALYIAVLRPDLETPEKVFSYLKGENKKLVYDDKDTKDMFILSKTHGINYKEIGSYYGLNASNICRRIKKLKKSKGVIWLFKKVQDYEQFILNTECASCARFYTKATKWAKCKGKKASTPCMAHSTLENYYKKTQNK